MLKEFKAFIMRGNVMDLAVGVIIGAAFGKIVSSLVNDILMPPLGAVIGGIDFSDMALTLKAPLGNIKPVTIRYGLFINNILDFLIMAFCVFLLVKAVSSTATFNPCPRQPCACQAGTPSRSSTSARGRTSELTTESQRTQRKETQRAKDRKIFLFCFPLQTSQFHLRPLLLTLNQIGGDGPGDRGQCSGNSPG